MSDDTASTPDVRVRKPGPPWASLLAALVAIAWLLLLAEPWLAAALALPAGWQRPETAYAVAGIAALLVLWDVYRYLCQRARHKADLQRLTALIDELWTRNKRLQLKAHTYAEHADKLKLFISDKLLEYIEYDEKFLHFKGIAAEVRHNGVISFDKVQTALQRAAAHEHSEAATQADDTETADYQAALDAMRYLWDLLDLSTADNLALHIADLLCECEEHYCQRVLAGDDDAVALPYEPAYPPRRAAWRALARVHDAPPLPADGSVYSVDDEHWHVRLEPVGEMLGNENHLVLLLENLLRNAQFFARKRGYSSPFAPIAVRLDEQSGHARIRVYNRGPPIREDDPARLFQLGYSTRRRREHQGRGLGLYFVNEIVKGYEGRISVGNIHTPEARYEVVLELDDGETIRDTVAVEVDDGQPRCRLADGGTAAAWNWRLRSPPRRAQVTPGGGEAVGVDGFAPKGRQERFDPAHPERPHWRLRYRRRRNAHEVGFEPLAIDGVEFEVRLPTAQQRLEDTGPVHEADIDAEVDRLDERLRMPRG